MAKHILVGSRFIITQYQHNLVVNKVTTCMYFRDSIPMLHPMSTLWQRIVTFKIYFHP